MNSKQARELLVALAACDPASTVGGVQDALASLGADGAGPWELSVRGGDAPAVKLGTRSASAGSGTRFSSAAFAEPVGSALKAFDALCPVAEVRRGKKGAWTLVLAKPLAWPLFLRCDLSAAYAPRAAQWSLALRDARVTALDFDGEALWARCSG